MAADDLAPTAVAVARSDGTSSTAARGGEDYTADENNVESNNNNNNGSSVLPVRAVPVFIPLVPFGGGTDSSYVVSGYAENEDPEIHRLSKIVLQLALTNFALSFFVELIVLVRELFRKNYFIVVSFVFWVAFAYYVMRLGIRGVQSRNAPCCRCGKEYGYLEAFRCIYIFLACLRAIILVAAWVNFDATEFIFNVLLLILLASTADYAKKLLNVIDKTHLPHTHVPPTTHTATAETVPMATAMPITTNDDNDDSRRSSPRAADDDRRRPSQSS